MDFQEAQSLANQLGYSLVTMIHGYYLRDWRKRGAIVRTFLDLEHFEECIETLYEKL